MVNHPNRSAKRPSLEETLLALSAEVERRANSLPSDVEAEYSGEYDRLIIALNEAQNAAVAFAPAFAKAGFAKL